jgi:imidazole glycerol-phosphate synthase subunit HisH
VRRITIGIVDYEVGNHASVHRALMGLGFRCRVSRDPEVLDATDLIILPGVGAFPAAMASLHRYDMIDYLRGSARSGKPFLGLCLGMQLMADASYEHGQTQGLGLIPGEVVPLSDVAWHIGWNAIEVRGEDTMFAASDGEAMYFNHSFVFDAAPEYVASVARVKSPLTAMVRRGNLVGIQFHPEKSQIAGHRLLRRVITELTDA